MKPLYVGIDVSKKQLDICLFHQISGEIQERSIANSDESILEFSLELNKRSDELQLIVLEATGGLQKRAAAQFLQSGLPVHIANPSRVRDFARSSGTLAKTDRIDAKIIARFGSVFKELRPCALLSDDKEQLKEWVSRRRDLVAMRAAEKNRAKSPVSRRIIANIQQHIEYLDEEIENINDLLDRFIDDNTEWKKQKEILETVPGVGDGLIREILTSLTEIGTANAKKIAALVGVAPINRDSGAKRGKRSIYGGRRAFRSALYMATLSATKYNPIIKKFYDELKKRGKPSKVALTACMRKLLTILNAMVKNNTPWNPNIINNLQQSA